MVRKRAGWLAVLFLGGMLTATAMGYYEGGIARAVVFALFVPLIISSGGNSGCRRRPWSSVAFALGEVESSRLVAGDAPRDRLGGPARGASWGGIGFCESRSGRRVSLLYGAHCRLVGGGRRAGAWWASCCAGRSRARCCRFFSGGWALIPQRRPRRSSRRWSLTGLVIYFTVASLVLSGTIL